MIAVVTGSSGFIGSHLVDALLARGATVRALVRPESAMGSRTTRMGYYTVNLLDERSVRESAIWDGVTHVFHAAGVTKRRALAQFRAGNVVPTANLFSAVATRAVALERFVLVSSQAAAGPALAANAPVREDEPRRPVEAYGRSKGEAEDVARRYSATLPITIVRPAAVYGPRDVDFLKIFQQASGPLAVYAAHRDQLMSIVHVRDLVEAILLAADAPAAVGRTYFVADAEPVTWRTLYALIAEVSGAHPIELQLPGPLLALAGQAGSLFSLITGRAVLLNSNKVALARPKWWLCDAARIRDELGWRERTSLLEGVRETYLSYCQSGELRARTSMTPTTETLEK